MKTFDSVCDVVRVNIEAFHVTKKITKVVLVNNHSESENLKEVLCNVVKEQLDTQLTLNLLLAVLSKDRRFSRKLKRTDNYRSRKAQEMINRIINDAPCFLSGSREVERRN